MKMFIFAQNYREKKIEEKTKSLYTFLRVHECEMPKCEM